MNFLRIFVFGIKNKKTKQLINLKLQKFVDRRKRKRIKEYKKIAIDVNDVLSRIFEKASLETPIKLEEHIENFKTTVQSKKYPSLENPYPINFGLDKVFCRLLFSICKCIKPNLVIETGIANGFSSCYILSAMEEINKGRLISIDDIFLPWHTKEKIGSAIPEDIKKRSTIIIGNSIIELKRLIKKEMAIDIFLHDSDHTYQNMMNEFRIVWPNIKKGGFLVSDDVAEHDAFFDFTDEVDKVPIIIYGKEYNTSLGIIQK